MIRLLPVPVLACAAFAFCLSPHVSAQEEAPGKAGEAQAAEAAPLPKVEAIREADVRKLIGQKAVVSGRVSNAHESTKGITFLTLEGGKFTVVCWKESYSRFEGGSPAKLYKDKTIEVTGDIFEYKGKDGKTKGQLEIKLRDPSQIRIVKDAAAKEEAKDAGAGPASAEKSDPPAPKAPEGRVDAKKYFR
jgi:hypothetical protein